MTTTPAIEWWESLRHGGMLIAPARLPTAFPDAPPPLRAGVTDRLRRELVRAKPGGGPDLADLLDVVLESVCGFREGWLKGSSVGSEWSTRTPLGEPVKPRRVWQGLEGATLPVFVDAEPRLGVGRSRRTVARVLEWLRSRALNLAVLTNGRQWRLVYAGDDHDAFCEWDTDLWFAEGGPGPQVEALRRLLSPAMWTPPATDRKSPLLQVILDSRKGQNELSAVLGERVRLAVEHLIRSHGPALDRLDASASHSDIYAAAVRTVMRMVVLLFAESRLLLPLDRSPVYYSSYSLSGLRDVLEREHALGRTRLAHRRSAWPRVLALFTLVRDGCGHPDMAVPKYGGDLFRSGEGDGPGMSRALAVFETACFQSQFDSVMSDADVREVLQLLSYSEVKVRQGRGFMRTRVPVDFSDLQSEYIGILYEGLLDFELRRAGPDEPIVFLAIGDEPALPLSRLEAMSDAAVRNLVEKFKVRGGGDEEDGDAEASDEVEEAEEEPEGEEGDEEEEPESTAPDDEPSAEADPTQVARQRAWAWADRAVKLGGMVPRPRSRRPEALADYERKVEAASRRLVRTAILPGQWYLVRWGGTRKGSGTFYTRPQLAVPTVHRTLRPLAYSAPQRPDGSPDADAPTAQWMPRKPEEILALKVCDPAVGSGSFPVAALRFLTEALYRSLEQHGRLREEASRTVIVLAEGRESDGRLDEDLLPCRPSDPEFELRLKSRLRRYVVERCLYGVDLDPLAVELARIALWIETMDRELPFSFLDHKFKSGNSLVGCWFARFRHYPVLAWEREGGDKNHSNGVHHEKEARSRAIRQFKSRSVKRDLIDFIDGQGGLFAAAEGKTPDQVHDDALQILEQMHGLPPGEDGEYERARLHHRLSESPSLRALKRAFDSWCAIWFWPADQLQTAPLASTFASLSPQASATVDELWRKHRFFHWELEFPDVFAARNTGTEDHAGFDAILGNPPWDTVQPNSKEWFSNVDPLYRTYGKQEALRKQTEYFRADEHVENEWIGYNAFYKDMANWAKEVGRPFGDRVTTDKEGRQRHDFPLGTGGRQSFANSAARHAAWKRRRHQDAGYADPSHPFTEQGDGKPYTYKLFTELALRLLRQDGRLGFVLPSGIYTDHGTTPLRVLLFDTCRWEWIFGFENRQAVFDIHRSFKFTTVLVAKGGTTEAVRTAFMRHDVDDWELGRAERLAVTYGRSQIERFSPNSRAILEIRTTNDQAILEKIYGNSVLLGDQGPEGWGIRYAQGDFNMTSDSKLFPPRPRWEEEGYQPDEYSRWLKGNWRSVSELWDELGVPRNRRAPNPEAPPPYQSLPIRRADIPPGIILSRNCGAWIREDEIDWEVETVEDEEGNEVEVRHRALALPLYQGVMVAALQPLASQYVSGAGNRSKWSAAEPWGAINPQFLIRHPGRWECANLVFRDVTNATNERTIVSTPLIGSPCGNVLGVLRSGVNDLSPVAALLASFTTDYTARQRISGTHLNLYVMEDIPLVRPDASGLSVAARRLVGRLSFTSMRFAAEALRPPFGVERSNCWRRGWALARHERLRLRCVLDALVASFYGLDSDALHWILRDCDYPIESVTNKAFARALDPKGFWRVDKTEQPEHRHTVLALVAFHDLQRHIAAAGGDRDRGMKAFLSQNDSEGWMIPETLRLADYGLGHDDRAQEAQPVAAALGPRFLEWQLAQDPEESWRECELHARNLLGEEGFERLQAQLRGEETESTDNSVSVPMRVEGAAATAETQGRLFR